MPEPNPLLGVHAQPGAWCWAHVRRESDGTLHVLAWGLGRPSERDGPPASAEASETLRAAAAVLGRRAYRRRGAFVAIPDVSGCLATAVVPPDELHLEGDDLRRELHESTPFDPDTADLRHRRVHVEGRRREFLFAALPVAQLRQEVAALGDHADATVGLGFAGVCLLRGATALGIAPSEGFLVEVTSRVTTVTAIEGRSVRRYLIACGADDLLRATGAARISEAPEAALATAAGPLADDLQSIAAYHRALRFAPKHPPDDLPPPRFVAVGPGLSAPNLRRALASRLRASLDPPDGHREPASTGAPRIVWDTQPGEDLPALAGAVGAALEALVPASEPMALRPPPTDVAEPAAPFTRRVAAGVAAGCLLVAAGTTLWRDGPWARETAGEETHTGPGAPAPVSAKDAPASDVRLVRAACVAAWRDALASAADALGDPEGTERSIERLTVRSVAAGAAWEVEVDVSVRGGDAAVAAALRDLGPDLDRRAARAVPGDQIAHRPDPAVGRVRAAWRIAVAAPDPGEPGERSEERLAALASAGRRQESGGDDAASPRGSAVVVREWAARVGDAPPAAIEFVALPEGGVRVEPAPTPAPLPRTLRRDPGVDLDAALARELPDLHFRAAEPDGSGDPPAISRVEGGAVRVSVPPGHRHRELERRGPGDAAGWTGILRSDGAAIDVVDDLPDGSGAYAWRVRSGATPGPEREVFVEVPVTLAVVGVADGGVRVRLARPWRGRVLEADAELRPGDVVRADVRSADAAAPVRISTGETIAQVRIVVSMQLARAPLPRYLPDGRIERDAEGRPVLEERFAERAVRSVEAVLRAADGTLRTVSGKMTDG